MKLPLFDIVLWAVVIAALVWAFRHVILYGRRWRAPTAFLVVAGLDALCGLLNGLLLSAHLAAVLGGAVQGRGFLALPRSPMTSPSKRSFWWAWPLPSQASSVWHRRGD
jgi:hypothetical protein